MCDGEVRLPIDHADVCVDKLKHNTQEKNIILR